MDTLTIIIYAIPVILVIITIVLTIHYSKKDKQSNQTSQNFQTITNTTSNNQNQSITYNKEVPISFNSNMNTNINNQPNNIHNISKSQETQNPQPNNNYFQYDFNRNVESNHPSQNNQINQNNMINNQPQPSTENYSNNIISESQILNTKYVTPIDRTKTEISKNNQQPTSLNVIPGLGPTATIQESNNNQPNLSEKK